MDVRDSVVESCLHIKLNAGQAASYIIESDNGKETLFSSKAISTPRSQLLNAGISAAARVGLVSSTRLNT